jgi:hypothetical protein
VVTSVSQVNRHFYVIWLPGQRVWHDDSGTPRLMSWDSHLGSALASASVGCS